jgi:hypothetical protein
VLAAILGMAGQGARVIVGLKKMHDTTTLCQPLKETFEAQRTQSVDAAHLGKTELIAFLSADM